MHGYADEGISVSDKVYENYNNTEDPKSSGNPLSGDFPYGASDALMKTHCTVFDEAVLDTSDEDNPRRTNIVWPKLAILPKGNKEFLRQIYLGRYPGEA